MVEKMTLHKALTELKTLDSRIDKAYNKSFISCIKEGGLVDGKDNQEDYEKKVKANMDSLQALIKRKTDIKKAVMKANSETDIVIGGKTMKIIDTINKKEIIKREKVIIEFLKSQLDSVQADCNMCNEKVDRNLQNIIEVALGKDNVKTSSGEIEAISKPYLETNRFKLIDPIGLDGFIEKRENEIDEFETNIDSSLSVANAITTIDI